MSVDRTVTRLLRCYPASWRSRYGDEVGALIADMSDGGSVSWRVRRNVVAAGVRERLASVLGGRDRRPEARMLGGTLVVLWAWALFVLGGSVVAKTAEHWSSAVPGGASSVSRTAYGVLIVGAVGAALLVLTGVAWGLPQFLALVRAGGWSLIRRRVLVAAVLTMLTAAATVGVVLLAGRMDDNHHVGSWIARAAFLGWAGLGAACLLCWTSAASATAKHLDLAAAKLQIELWLATMVSILMAVMTVATATWWVSVARVAPDALTGGAGSARGTAVVPELVLALVLMVLASVAGAEGTRRAFIARRAVPGRQ